MAKLNTLDNSAESNFKVELTFFVGIIISVENLAVAVVALGIFSNHIRTRVLLVFQGTRQAQTESAWSIAAKLYEHMITKSDVDISIRVDACEPMFYSK